MKYQPGIKIDKLTIINRNKNTLECICECGNKCFRNTCTFSKKSRTSPHSCGCSAKIGRKYDGYHLTDILSRLRNGAKQRHLKIEKITPEFLIKLYNQQNQKCAISGINISLPKKQNEDYTASIDRINSREGYLLNNIQWVHKNVNQMKWTFTKSELIQWCKLILENQGFKVEKQ
jgi:hypothetical protein